MKNVAGITRREVQAHRRFVTGLTASYPQYKAVDAVGNKEFVADIYLGPLLQTEVNIIRDVPVAKYAQNLVTGIRMPVLLERSKQGKYTVVARADTQPPGAQGPEGSILEPTYNQIEYNLAELDVLHIADITYQKEQWGAKPWGAPGKPWQDIIGTDAFGNQVMGGDVAAEDVPEEISLVPVVHTTTRHILIQRKTWGPIGGAHALRWGVDPWGATEQVVVEQTS